MKNKTMKLEIVCPVYNEQESIKLFLHELAIHVENLTELGVAVTVILVNDGSTDATLEVILKHRSSIDLKVINLSRNFGHQSAVWAGLEESNSEAYSIVMDADLQDPPSYLLKIHEVLDDGADVVFMRRKSRKDGFWKKFFAARYYRLQSRLTGTLQYMNIGDFYGISPRAKIALLSHSEEVKYIRGLLAEVGFNQRFVDYDRSDRVAGKTHYSIGKMLRLALAGVTGFSIRPLFWVVYSSLGGSVLAVIMGGYIVFLKLKNGAHLQPGWAFLSLALLGMSALILLSLAVVALYIARIIQEIKNRPIYFKQDVVAIDAIRTGDSNDL